MIGHYRIVSLESGPELPETLGTKEKFWIDLNGQLHLFKFGRDGTGEDWAEKVVCELCQLLDIPHAHYDLARYRGRNGVLSPTIVDDGGRLILGNEIINGASPQYDGARIYKQKEHTVSRVHAAITTFLMPEAWRQFIGYLMLDAWVGNTDRHHENWALIRSKDGHRSLAPTFDHASSLGRELSDEVRIERMNTRDERYSVEAFAERARSALYAEPSDLKPLSTVDAFYHAAKSNKKVARDWLERLRQASDESVLSVVNGIPPEIMSEAARSFAVRLLQVNKHRLLRLGDGW